MSDSSAGSSYGHVPDGPPPLELYDHGTDPGEFVNLADRAEHAARDAMVSELQAEWDPAAIQRAVVRSQWRRFLIERAVGRELF